MAQPVIVAGATAGGGAALGPIEHQGTRPYSRMAGGVKIVDMFALGAGLAGMTAALHDHPSLPQCLVKRVYAYAVGTPSASVDPVTLEQLDKQFVAGGYRLLDTQFVTDQTSRTSSGGSLSPRPGRSAA